MRSGDTCFIYLLTNIVNDKIYIGQTWLPLHLRMGKDGSNYKNSVYLHNAIVKYGADNFKYEVLVKCEDQETADSLEEYYIDQYNSRNHEIGYNLKQGGRGGKHSEETKEKIRNSIKNKEWSSEALIGRAQGGKSWKGKKRGPHTEEWKNDNSQRTKEWHQNNIHPMSGKNQSEEAKTKISKANRGRKLDPEMVKNRSIKRMMNPEREQAILQSYKDGKIISEIEKEFKTGRSSIYRLLKRNNISRER